MKIDRNYSNIFILLSVISAFMLVLWLFFIQGSELNHFFFYDTMDTGMDFFNSMLYLKGRHPYTQYHAIYPPLANAIFWFLSHLITKEEKAGWPDTFEGSVEIRRSELDLRVHQASFFPFIISVVIISVAFVMVISLFYKRAYYGLFFGIVCSLSYGWMFALERGNIITLSLIFLLLFLKFYHSESKWLRELAYISLAFSAGIKIYPALFGVLLLYEKNWKNVIKTVVYGVIAFVLPFAMFDGMDGFRAFLSQLMTFSNKDSAIDSITRYNVQGIVRSFLIQIGELFHLNVTDAVMADYSVLSLWITVSLAVGLFLLKKNWKRILLLGLLMVLLQDSVQYTLVFLMPALLFFCLEEEVSKNSVVYFLFLAFSQLMAPFAFQWKEYNLTGIIMLGQYSVAGLTILMLVDIYRELFCLEGKKGKLLRAALGYSILLTIGYAFFRLFLEYQKQTSDMTYHIMFAQRLFHQSLSDMAAEDPGIPIQAITYPLYHLALKVAAFCLGRDYTLACAVLLVITILASILLYRMLLLRIMMPTKTSQKLLCDLISFCSVIFVTARGPWNDWRYYAVQYAANPVHNPTLLFVRPFGIILVLAFLLFLDAFEKKEKYRGFLVVFAVASLLSILVKPSFAIVFLPALGILTILKMIRQKSIKVGIWAFLAVLPSLAVLLWQLTFTTGSTETMQVQVIFGTYYGLGLLQVLGASLAVFPVPILLVSRKLFVKEDAYKIVSLALVFGWIQVFFLSNGPTGDFSWGYDLAVQFATAVSLVCAWKHELPRWRRWAALTVFLYQTICGIGYLLTVYQTMNVWQ